MNAQIKELLKPEILNSINGMELIARVIVEGFMSGSNKSQTIGAGQEFSQYRNYEPGDDLRQLDWKMYARSERYYIKQAEIETNITVKFVIDASNSMSYSEANLSKLQYTKVLTAVLAYLARKQSDSFGLYTLNNKHTRIVEPRSEHQQFLRFLNALIEVKPEGTWEKKNSVEHLFKRHGKEMVVFMTDLYDDDNDLLTFITRLKTPRNEVIVFHLMGEHEIIFDYNGSFTFQDLESKTLRRVETTAQRNEYISRVEHWIKQSRLWLYERKISYQLIRLDDPFENSLRDFLKIRKLLIR